MSAPALQVEGVSHGYGRAERRRLVLEEVSFELAAARTVAVVGESGAGKTTLARLLAGLEHPDAGRVLVDGTPPAIEPGRVSPVQMVFQHPAQALNRFESVGASVAEPLLRLPRSERVRRVAELLGRVGIDPARAGEKPRRFSGGQLQRIVLARALAGEPRLLLCDEPTSALDVSVQAQIVNLLLELQAEQKFACVLVTHDLAVAKVLADEVLVLRDGHVVEHADVGAFFERPLHPYARGLLATTAEQTLTRPTSEAEVEERR